MYNIYKMASKTEKENLIEILKFKGTWRSYQQRVLDELERHLDDKKLNVVAAPGAGKTTLGIEVMARLGHNALILAPTITIRNQWKQRILEGFLPSDANSAEISLDIRNISEITISTYQALHTIYKMPGEKEKFLNALNRNNIKTLVLDEAHHLRTEWYQTLNKLCEYLDEPDFTVVSLTGTPPYDVSPEEWNNYHSLCGPVDAEISIPELVKNGDLCPHQDLIYFSNLSIEEEKTVFDFEKNRKDFFNYINKSPDFMYGIESSAFLNDMDKNYDLIFQNTNFTISLISYLLSVDKLSTHARVLAEFLDLRLDQIPGFDYNSAQTLFNGIIGDYEPYFKNVDLVKSKLREFKLINGKKADFIGEIDFKKIFARSKNKLDAIFDITKNEYQNRKKDLREVILLDYIGKGDSEGLNIFSVFDRLVLKDIPLGILTGTLIVIPKTAKEELYKILEERNIDPSKVLTTNFCSGYLRVETYGEVNIVSVITKLFEKGLMNVLIGTAALLGEGWDSPCVNTLIIASVVGSFMLSNQMRGRALRIDKNNPDKTSNIWHLASITAYEDIESPDFVTIQKRFNTFEGINYKDNEIRNGIERLGKVIDKFDANNCKDLNETMFKYAKDINGLKEKWNQVFKKSEITEDTMTSQIYEIAETHFQAPEQVEYNNFLEKMVGGFHQRQKIKMSNKEQLTLANCLLKTLCDMDKIKTPYEDIEIKSYTDRNGNFCITILDCSNIERNIFIKSFNELFVLDDRLRYILKITKKDFVTGKDETKYLPVPEFIGLNQKFVKMFTNNLKGKKNEIQHNYNTVKGSEESYLEKADKNTKIQFYLGKDYKNITLYEYKNFIKFYLKYLNEKGILKKKYSDIEVKAYKKDRNSRAQNHYKENILLSFFNCTDYERNLIINNLCEVFYSKNSLKTKEEDGIVYFNVPMFGKINNKYEPIIWEYFIQKNEFEDTESYNGTDILTKSMKISGVITGICALGLLLFLSVTGFLFKEIIIQFLIMLSMIAILFYFVILYPVDFIVESINHTKKGDFDYSIINYSKKINNITSRADIMEFIVYLPYILGLYLIIGILNLVVVLPMNFIACCIKSNDEEILMGGFTLLIVIFSIFLPASGYVIAVICGLSAVICIIISMFKDNILKFLNGMKDPSISSGLTATRQVIALIILFFIFGPILGIIIAFIFCFLYKNKDILNNRKSFNPIAKFKKRIQHFIIRRKYKASLQKNTQIDIIFTKSDKNRQEVLKAKYNAYLLADIKRSRVWI